MRNRDWRSVWLILQNEQKRVGDLRSGLQPSCCCCCCCVDLSQVRVRLAQETESPSDLCRPGRVMEAVKGSTREEVKAKANNRGGGGRGGLSDI